MGEHCTSSDACQASCESPAPAPSPEPALEPKPTPEADPAPSPCPEGGAYSSGLGSFSIKVQGGTTSSAYDKVMAQQKADADARRQQDAEDKRVGRTPIEQGGGMMFEHRLTDSQFSPKAHVTYVGKGREFISDQLVDLFEDEIAGDKMLVFVCPECVRRGRDSGQSQCHARDSHRKWHIDTRTAGIIKTVENAAVPGGLERYLSGGEIMDTDTLACSHPYCGCAFKIHKNMMYRVK